MGVGAGKLELDASKPDTALPIPLLLPKAEEVPLVLMLPTAVVGALMLNNSGVRVW